MSVMSATKAAFLIQYIRGVDNRPYGVMFANPYIHDGLVCIGVAICNTKHDEFDKAEALKLAQVRCANEAKPPFKFYKLPEFPAALRESIRKQDSLFPHCISISDEVQNFVHRCTRYYKDKQVLYPHIMFTE